MRVLHAVGALVESTRSLLPRDDGALSEAGVPATVGLSMEQREEAAWAIEPGEATGKPRRRYRGVAAINAYLAAVALGVRLPLSFYGLPGVRRLQEYFYGLVAANRHRLPGDVHHCNQCPEECR